MTSLKYLTFIPSGYLLSWLPRHHILLWFSSYYLNCTSLIPHLLSNLLIWIVFKNLSSIHFPLFIISTLIISFTAITSTITFIKITLQNIPPTLTWVPEPNLYYLHLNIINAWNSTYSKQVYFSLPTPPFDVIVSVSGTTTYLLSHVLSLISYIQIVTEPCWFYLHDTSLSNSLPLHLIRPWILSIPANKIQSEKVFSLLPNHPSHSFQTNLSGI